MVLLFDFRRHFFRIVLSCGYWSWRLCWGRELNNNEGEAVQALLYVLTGLSLAENIADSWVWAMDPLCRKYGRKYAQSYESEVVVLCFWKF
jgi:hypothetical protein